MARYDAKLTRFFMFLRPGGDYVDDDDVDVVVDDDDVVVADDAEGAYEFYSALIHACRDLHVY